MKDRELSWVVEGDRTIEGPELTTSLEILGQPTNPQKLVRVQTVSRAILEYEVHYCRLQAIYHPITGKNLVTLYTEIHRGNLLFIPVINLKSVILALF